MKLRGTRLTIENLVAFQIYCENKVNGMISQCTDGYVPPADVGEWIQTLKWVSELMAQLDEPSLKANLSATLTGYGDGMVGSGPRPKSHGPTLSPEEIGKLEMAGNRKARSRL